MRLPVTEHTDRPWRIHEVVPDFRVEDVWAFRMPGAGADDFPAVLSVLRDAGKPDGQPLVVRFLFAVRWKLGALFGWDEPDASVASLRDRLPADLRATSNGAAVPGIPFSELYELPTESAMEIANATMHGVAHFGWVHAATGDYELRMAVLVKPNGVLGQLYMAAILPFRYAIVYPAMTRQWERAWREHVVTTAPRR